MSPPTDLDEPETTLVVAEMARTGEPETRAYPADLIAALHAAPCTPPKPKEPKQRASNQAGLATVVLPVRTTARAQAPELRALWATGVRARSRLRSVGLCALAVVAALGVTVLLTLGERTSRELGATPSHEARSNDPPPTVQTAATPNPPIPPLNARSETSARTPLSGDAAARAAELEAKGARELAEGHLDRARATYAALSQLRPEEPAFALIASVLHARVAGRSSDCAGVPAEGERSCTK